MPLLHPSCLPPSYPHRHFFFSFLSFIFCLEVSAKRASFSEKQKEWIDWVISCCSGGPFDQNWKAVLHVRILLQQLFLSFTITTHHGHTQSFPSLSPHSLRVRACSDEHYDGSFCALSTEHWVGRYAAAVSCLPWRWWCSQCRSFDLGISLLPTQGSCCDL